MTTSGAATADAVVTVTLVAELSAKLDPPPPPAAASGSGSAATPPPPPMKPPPPPPAPGRSTESPSPPTPPVLAVPASPGAEENNSPVQVPLAVPPAPPPAPTPPVPPASMSTEVVHEPPAPAPVTEESPAAPPAPPLAPNPPPPPPPPPATTRRGSVEATPVRPPDDAGWVRTSEAPPPPPPPCPSQRPAPPAPPPLDPPAPGLQAMGSPSPTASAPPEPTSAYSVVPPVTGTVALTWAPGPPVAPGTMVVPPAYVKTVTTCTADGRHGDLGDTGGHREGVLAGRGVGAGVGAGVGGQHARGPAGCNGAGWDDVCGRERCHRDGDKAEQQADGAQPHRQDNPACRRRRGSHRDSSHWPHLVKEARAIDRSKRHPRATLDHTCFRHHGREERPERVARTVTRLRATGNPPPPPRPPSRSPSESFVVDVIGQRELKDRRRLGQVSIRCNF